MKAILLILCLCFSFAGTIAAQTGEHIFEKSDSIVAEKDNLYLLIERIYLATKACKTGVFEYDKYETLEEQKQRSSWQEFYEETGRYPTPVVGIDEKPAPIVELIQEGEIIYVNKEELRNIPSDFLASIEILYGPTETCLYGLSGQVCVIRVKLNQPFLSVSFKQSVGESPVEYGIPEINKKRK